MEQLTVAPLVSKMKFIPVALAALACFSDAAATRNANTDRQIKARMEKGEFNKRTLIRGAKPYDEKTKRKLEQNYNNYQFEITGDYSVRFDSCFSLTVQSDELFDDNIINYATEGSVVAQKSYVLFNVCETKNCYYYGDDASMTFITDIGTFFSAFADYLPNQQAEYCEGCQQNDGYCSGEWQNANDDQQEQYNQAYQKAYNNGNRRKLEDGNNDDNVVTAYVDCDTCEKNGCFEAQDNYNYNNGQDYMEDSLEWLQGLSECQAIEDNGNGDYQNSYYYSYLNNDDNDNELYAGLMCNEAGTGVEIGVFLDEGCSLYAKNMAYKDIMGYYDKKYYSMTEELVEYMFTNEFSCFYQETVYTNPWTEEQEAYAQAQEEAQAADDYQQAADDYQQADNDDQQAADGDQGNRALNNNNYQYNKYYYQTPEAAEWCQQLFDGEMEVMELESCGGYANGYYNDEDGNANDDYDQNLKYYGSWYSYDLTEDAADNAGQVCLKVQAMQGEYSRQYNTETSGSLYDYNTKEGSSSWTSKGRLAFNATQIFGIVLAAVIGASMILCWCYCVCCGKRIRVDDKPLISEVKGRGRFRL